MTKTPPHPVQAWLGIMRHSLDRIESYEHLDKAELRLEFACANRQLRLGWPLIVYLKSQQQTESFVDESDWYQNDDRFERFAAYAWKRILLAGSRRNIPTPVEGSSDLKKLLDLLIKIGSLEKHRLKNPPGWEHFAIAPMLFAKSVCILTDSPHTYLTYAGLSFLLARLEKVLYLD